MVLKIKNKESPNNDIHTYFQGALMAITTIRSEGQQPQHLDL